jgi:hypothetical protein
VLYFYNRAFTKEEGEGKSCCLCNLLKRREKGRFVTCVREEGEGRRVPLLERRDMGRKWILASS